MERRADIRAAMQSLLTPTKPNERGSSATIDPSVNLIDHITTTLPCPESMLNTIGEIQEELKNSGIMADTEEILQAIVKNLSLRPGLCRQLLAENLLR